MSTAVFIGGRNIARSVRAPMLLAISLLQPVIWLALFSQTFGGLGGVAQFRAQGYQDYLSFLTPGMVVLSMLFTGLQSGMATMSDIDSGMMDKFLVSPVRRLTILAGRVGADTLTMLAQGAIILVIATAMGVRATPGPAGAVALIALATAFGVIWAALSNLVALLTRNAELTMALGFLLTLPVLFMSSAFFPLRLQPAWLQRVADANPAAYVITAGQQLLNTGNNAPQDVRTIIALAAAAVIALPATLLAFRKV